MESHVRRRADIYWRTIATGLCYFIFGLFGLLVGGVVLPASRIFVRQHARRERIARRIIAFTFRRFIGLAHGLGIFQYELKGFERLAKRGMLVLANHPSLLDTVFLLGFVPDSTCVVDDELFQNAFTRNALSAAGYIRNSGGSDVLRQCADALDAGTNVLIFPEGTRTPIDGTVRLRRGAANIAVRGNRDVTPVIIRCWPRTLTKGEKWWQVPPRPASYSFLVGEDLAVRSFSVDGEAPGLAVRRLTAYLEEHFNTESVAHGVP